MDIDDAIDDLLAAIGEHGLPAPKEPSTHQDFARLERTIAPLTLPPDLRRFWQRIDPTTLPVVHGAELSSPAAALRNWQNGQAESEFRDPAHLLPIGYGSSEFVGVALSGESEGGSVWAWFLDDDYLGLVFPTLAGYFRSTAQSLRDGRVEEREEGDAQVRIDTVEFDDNPFRLALADKASRKRSDPATWPDEWLALQSHDWSMSVAVGASHTVDQLLSPSDASWNRGRVHARVLHVGTPPEDELPVTAADATGELNLMWNDAHFGPPELGTTYELDVTVDTRDRSVSLHDVRRAAP